MTVIFRHGERAYDRIIKAQPASTTGPITNGEPLDSGTVMFASSNMAHICREGVRNLVQSPGLGLGGAKSYANDLALFGALRDFDLTPESSGFFLSSDIPWDPRCAECFPCHIICDRQIGGEASPSDHAIANEGRLSLRSIRYSIDVDIDATNSASSWYMAVTLTPNTRLLVTGAPPNVLAYASGSFGGTGHKIQTGTLSSDVPWHPRLLQEWPCRAAAYADGATRVMLVEAYIWFGWKFVGVGTNTINGLSAWESRIDPA